MQGGNRVVAIAAILFAVPAVAADDQRFYGALHGEFSFVEETDLDIGGARVGDLEFDMEYAVGAAIGYYPPKDSGFLSQTRYELELMYREADFDTLNNSTLAPGGFGGSIESTVGMANAYYDYDTGTRWTPYIGLGLGVAQHTFDSLTVNVDDEDTAFAYQGMVGVGYHLEPYKRTVIGIGYRYFGTADPEFSDASGASVEHEYNSHNLEFFLRIPF